MNDPLAIKLFWLCIAFTVFMIWGYISYTIGKNEREKQAICKVQTHKAYNQDAGQYINKIA